MARVYANANRVAAHHVDTIKAVRDAAKEGGRRSKARLDAARASSDHTKIYGPSHVTGVTVTHGDLDSFINLEGTDPMAIEFGHFPSGYFAPEKYGRITKAPTGLYIITIGSGAGGSMSISSGRKRGKR
ncbi:hypothetical protein SEA_PHARAOH_21 [Mycobacterium phage Pharaoh]|uniref:Head-to-tail connector protein n=1 Tax=Mycobacterium phage Pharaoh TaxID=2530140 RepID=A0A481W1V9_9CAUD|nr:tail completion or Neck1 protein [Mycobacterium phage Pharaoh]QBJ00210.1 hypothetical protein SEA_PHARAOH_21 [Mycobacterium phage Pharaoh]